MIGRSNRDIINPAEGFADIHTHILPGVDDGAQDMPQALALLRMAYEDGTRSVFLTPHYRGQYKQNSPAWLREVFSMFCQMAQQELPDIKLYLGNEVYFEQEAPARLAAGQILPMNNSRYCLLEFHAGALRSQIITGVSEMLCGGFTPIIAHAERYSIFVQDRTLVDEVLDMGALIQLNADSVMNGHGRAVSMFCQRLLKERKAHFIATDAHDASKRPPLLQECFRKVCKKYGQEYAAGLFYENARAVAENKEI